MYISVNRRVLRNCLIYAAATAFAAFFGGIYEIFSHDVYSYYMLYAFAIPLAMGVIPHLCVALNGKDVVSDWGSRLYNSGVAALTVGSIFYGVLEIYGTTNSLAAVYPIVGGALVLAGVIISVIRAIRAKKPKGFPG